LRQDRAVGTWQSAAALNNAEWCDLVVRSHGGRTRFGSDAWTSQDRTAVYYPDAVTLVPRLAVPELLSRIDTSAGCSVKDSFTGLDLTPYGFRVPFHADWVVRLGPPPLAPSGGPKWERVARPDELATWEDAWRAEDGPRDLFRAELLDDASVTVLAAYQHEAVVAGAILSRSATVVGISNVFVRSVADLDPWPGCLAFAGELFPDKPVVGSESEDSLLQAERNGFRLLGPSAYGSTTAVASKSASEERLQDNWRSWVPGET
jgi:hypothetical protein